MAKKYRSLKADLIAFENELEKNPLMGDDFGDNTRKVRMAIASKNKGKSGGARVVTCTVLIDVENSKIYLLTIYDKGTQDAISKEEIQHLKKISELI
jgi:hypothetical protein